MVSAAVNHEGVVLFLLKNNASPLVRDKNGRSPMHVAAARGNFEALKTLLDFYSNNQEFKDQLVNIRVEITENGENDVYDSWLHQHDSLLPRMPELSEGSTPLHAASQYSKTDCVQLLLDAGADPELCDSRGLSALDVAGEVVYIPDEEQTNLSGPVRSSFTPFGFAKAGYQDKKEEDSTNNIISKFLWLKPKRLAGKSAPRAKLERRSRRQISATGKEKAATFLHTAIRNGDEGFIKRKLNEHYNMLEFYEKGLTPVHVAVEVKNLNMLKLFLDTKDEHIVNTTDVYGRTLLYMAVQEEWKEGVDLLLDAEADVFTQANDGTTVLDVAAGKKDSSILKELLTIQDTKKIINEPDDRGRTPLYFAVEEVSVACVKILLHYNASASILLRKDITLLHIAARSGSSEILEILLTKISSYGEDILRSMINMFTDVSEGGMTPLHEACKEGHIDCVKLLLKYGAADGHNGKGIFFQTKSTLKPYYGATPLHLAARYDYVDVAEVLLECSEETLVKYNADKWQPLHVAARFAKVDCVRLFLKWGSSLAKQVADGSGVKKTALDMIVNFIPRPIEFLLQVFDSFITTNEFPVTHADCIVKFNFALLSPNHQSDHSNQLVVLDAVINSSKLNIQEILLLHPLAETFLYLKWKKLRKFFFIMFAIYCVFTISLTSMCLETCTVPSAYYLPSNLHLARISTAVCLILIMSQELFQAIRLQHYYWTDTESWIKWATLIMAGWLLLPSFKPGGTPPICYTNTSSIAVLFAWIEFLFLLSRLPNWGFSVLMFCRVAQNVIKVLATFVFLFIGFTFAFMIEFKSSVPFPDIWRALVKVIVMTSEMEYTEMFENPIDEGIMWPIVSRSIFLSFVVLITIVLMNLMVGVAVNDISVLEAQGRMRRLAKQVSFLSFMEMFVNNRCLTSVGKRLWGRLLKRIRHVPVVLKLHTGKPRDMKRFPTNLRNSIIDTVSNIQKSQTDNSTNDLAQLTEKIDKLIKHNKHNEDCKVTHKSQSELSLRSTDSEAEDRAHREVTLMLLHQVLGTLTEVKLELSKAKMEGEKLVTPVQIPKGSFKKKI